MTDLDRRFQTLDLLETTDLWSVAVERASAPERPAAPWWRSRPLAVTSLAALLTVTAGAVLWLTLRPAPTPPAATDRWYALSRSPGKPPGHRFSKAADRITRLRNRRELIRIGAKTLGESSATAADFNNPIGA